MKRLLTFCLSLIVTFSMSAVVSISIGRGRPVSKAVQYWHLTDCVPPCWAGITPGATSPPDAVAQVSRFFRDHQMVQLRDSAVGWGQNDVKDDETNLITLESDERGVYAITINANGNNKIMPTLGDTIAVLGSPTCIFFLGSADYSSSDLFYTDTFGNVVMIVRAEAEQFSITVFSEMIDIFPFYGSCQDMKKAVPWRGFRSAELYLAEIAARK